MRVAKGPRNPPTPMKTPPCLKRLSSVLLPVLVVLGFSACVAPSPPRPVVAYPVSYQVPIGNTQVSANDGPQNLNVNANQDVSVEPGKTIYYQVVSPVDVVLTIYELSSDGMNTVSSSRLSQTQGNSFTASITPAVRALRFSFSAAQANTSGTARFTISDRPIAAAVTGTTTTTTTTRTTTSP